MPQSTATVVATYSRRMRIEFADGSQADARIKGKKLRPVCGDGCVAESIANESDWLITGVLPRRNQLSRPNLRGKVEVLAANIDWLLVVAAASPPPDWFIIDRYLCAAASMRADAAVIFNKTDIAAADDNFAEYHKLGYATIPCSVSSGANIARIAALLQQQTALVVGQSGVGKSSIINALLGSKSLRTAAISDKSQEGRHTTVNSEMLQLPTGGKIIDSPGVRDYAPALQDIGDVANGYREIASAAQDCQFANCRHFREPGCAVKARVAAQQISERRYESYRRLLALTTRLDKPY